MKDVPEEMHIDLPKVEMTSHSYSSVSIGNIVKWKYENKNDPQYGMLYVVVGFNSEYPKLVVTRVLNNPYSLREFHISQLEIVN